MNDTDIPLRVKRIARGERRHDDFDRIFLHLRGPLDRRSSVRDIGDFIAHRDNRDSGLVNQHAQDLLTSFRNWIIPTVTGRRPSTEEIVVAGEANLRIATNEQLKRAMRLDRGGATSAFRKGVEKLKKGEPINKKQRLAVNYLGGTWIWQPAYSDASLFDELVRLLKAGRYLMPEDVAGFERASPFLTKHVIALLHGVKIAMKDGNSVELIAKHSRSERVLGVKMVLTVNELVKPVSEEVFLFHSHLLADDHCDPVLLADETWKGKHLEVRQDGLLAALT
ncbi:hypothetical protein [Rhizobium johnstonii]|uniref:hypothetical protein n=1 Tax=Rhizobium johnstonii TaxID=3019933 RepID=UPI003F9D59B4